MHIIECKCGFKFSGPGEFRNCEAFIITGGYSGITCPKCETHYIDGVEYLFADDENTEELEEATD